MLYSPWCRSSVQFTLLYGLLNAYLVTLSFAYSPADRAMMGQPKLH